MNLWSGPRLLVPMTVDALALGKPNLRQISEQFSQVGIDYTQLRNTTNPVPTPSTFQVASGTGLPQEGVELHWTVPAGLRAGHSKPEGVEFPLLPNRWLVIRSVVKKNTAAKTPPTLSAWLLQSDKEDQINGQSVWPDPDSNAKYTFIGVATELTSPMDDEASKVKRLYAMAPGSPAFAVTYQSSQNVLAFYDPLTSLEESEADISYSVIGFFNPTSWDPLFGASQKMPQGFADQKQWQENIEALQMQVGDGTPQALSNAQTDWHVWAEANHIDPSALPDAQQNLPGQLLPFGAVQKLEWRGVEAFYENNNLPPSGQIPVAIGNTPSEALGAWLNDQLPDSGVVGYSIEHLIQALMTDSVNTFLTDSVTFEFTTASLTFSGSAGGYETVVALPDDQNTNQTTIPLNPLQTQALTDLNADEITLNRLKDALRSRQWSLFAAQWKQVRQPANPSVQNAIRTLTDQVDTLVQTITTTEESVIDQRSALDRLLGSQYIASLQPLDQYQEANDPVILCASLRADDKIIERSLDKRDLDCRMSGQFLTGFNIAVGQTGPARVTDKDLAAELNLSFLDYASIPLEAKYILLESLMLDPGLQPWLASLWLKSAGGGPDLNDVETAINNIQAAVKAAPNLDDSLSAQLMADVVGFEGVAPDPLANQDWEQPWSPVYIAWEGEWHPTSTKPADALSDWKLDEIDFEWQSKSEEISSVSFNYDGRTLLNSDAPSILASRISALLQTPDLKIADYIRADLKKIAKLLVTSDIFVQSLSGFSDALIQRSISEAEGNQPGNQTPDNATVPNPPNNNTPDFLPIRSGHLALSKLWVMDGWGQTFKAEVDNGYVVPIRSESMVTPGGAANQIYAQLPPRLNQPARIDFNLINANSEPPTPSNSADDTSPICGFVAADFLSGGLLIFDSLGFAQGVILPIIRDDLSQGVRWEAAPGINIPLGSRPTLSNKHLFGMVNGILRQTEQGVDALGELLDLIDGVSHCATQGETKGNLSILIGQPLAVVRCSVDLQLNGDPVYDQAYDNTDKQVTHHYTTVSFPLRVGDMGIPGSGVTGYYLDDDYSKINAVYGYNPDKLRRAAYAGPESFKKVTTELPENISQSINLKFVQLNNLVSVTPSNNTQYSGTDTPHKKISPAMLTVLMEPTAQLPIIMGYLPVQTRRLPPGIINTALTNVQFITRTGPLLVNPDNIRMPLPADIKGTWDYIWRDSVTTWSNEQVSNQDAQATLVPKPLQLYWGWMRLSGAFSSAPDSGPTPSFASTPEIFMTTPKNATEQLPNLQYTLSPTSVLINQTMPIQIGIQNISGHDVTVGFDFTIVIKLPVGAKVDDLIEPGQQSDVSASAIDRHWTPQVTSSDSEVTIKIQAVRPFVWNQDDAFTLVINQVAVNSVEASHRVAITAQVTDGTEAGDQVLMKLSKISSGLTISAFANPEKVGSLESTKIYWTATDGAKVELRSNQPTQSTELKGDGPVFSGEFEVLPNQDVPQTLYTVEVQNGSNTQRERTLVVVNVLPPAIHKFSAENTSNLDFTKPVKLFWDTTYAKSATMLPTGIVVPIQAEPPEGYDYTPANFISGNETSVDLTLYAMSPVQPTARSEPLTLEFALAEIIYFSYQSLDPNEGISVPIVKNAYPPLIRNSGDVWTITVTGPGGPLVRTIGEQEPEVRYFGPDDVSLDNAGKTELQFWVHDFKQEDELILQPTGQKLIPNDLGQGSVEVDVTETTDFTLEATLSGVQINNTIRVTVNK